LDTEGDESVDPDHAFFTPAGGGEAEKDTTDGDAEPEPCGDVGHCVGGTVTDLLSDWVGRGCGGHLDHEFDDPAAG